MLLKKYKNQLFYFIEKHPMGVDAFSFSEENEMTYILTHKDTNFTFEIAVRSYSFDEFNCRYTLFRPKHPLSEFLYCPSFDLLLQKLSDWLIKIEQHVEELESIDLWKEYRKGETILDIQKIDFNDRTNFSLDERKQVHLALNELKLLIQNKFETSAEEQKLVTERLDYLKEASDRLNRFDWKNLAISTIIAISITLSLDTKSGQELFNLFKQVFRIMPLLFGGDAN